MARGPHLRFRVLEPDFLSSQVRRACNSDKAEISTKTKDCMTCSRAADRLALACTAVSAEVKNSPTLLVQVVSKGLQHETSQSATLMQNPSVAYNLVNGSSVIIVLVMQRHSPNLITQQPGRPGPSATDGSVAKLNLVKRTDAKPLCPAFLRVSDPNTCPCVNLQHAATTSRCRMGSLICSA